MAAPSGLVPLASGAQLDEIVARMTRRTHLVLVGDADPRMVTEPAVRRRSIPAHYAKAEVNVQFGSSPEIATDNWYADLDDDRVPDVAVGRITCDSASELTLVVEKILAGTSLVEVGRVATKKKYVDKAGQRARLSDLKQRWPAIKARLEKQLLPAKEIERRLRVVGAPVHPEEIGATREQSLRDVMVAAHMDEISFMVTHIDDEGFIRFHPLGGFDPKTLSAQRVIVHGREDIMGVMGSKPVHLMTPEEKNKNPQLRDYFIDTGRSAAQVKELVDIGDPITRERDLIMMGECINGKSLDNRVSVYILIEVLKALKGKSLPYDFYAAFTVQEEVGLRGAFNAAGHIDPDFGSHLESYFLVARI